MSAGAYIVDRGPVAQKRVAARLSDRLGFYEQPHCLARCNLGLAWNVTHPLHKAPYLPPRRPIRYAHFCDTCTVQYRTDISLKLGNVPYHDAGIIRDTYCINPLILLVEDISRYIIAVWTPRTKYRANNVGACAQRVVAASSSRSTCDKSRVLGTLYSELSSLKIASPVYLSVLLAVLVRPAYQQDSDVGRCGSPDLQTGSISRKAEESFDILQAGVGLNSDSPDIEQQTPGHDLI